VVAVPRDAIGTVKIFVQALDSAGVIPIIGASFLFFSEGKEVIMTSKRNSCPVYDVCVRDIPET
jgi:hypothetical protein